MRRGRAGFTLLETVVSLTILAGLAGFLVVAFRLAGSSIERGEAEAREMARLRAGIAVFERSLRSAEATPLPGGRGAAPYFLGEPKRVRFLSSSSVTSGPGGGFRLLSFFESDGPPGEEGLALADASPFRPEGAESWDGRENARLFLPGAAGVAFSYSPGPTEEGMWEWFETWDVRDAATLPRAVRVEFTMPSATGPRKNAFVVPVMAGGAG